MTPNDVETEALLTRAGRGDLQARDLLLLRHQGRLTRMVAVRMDRRLAARLDPSDVVQEALAEAARRLAGYLERPSMPFYPWLRQLAWQRLVDLHRQHVRARKRSIAREEPCLLPLPDESAAELGRQLLAAGSSPSQRALKKELYERVQEAMVRLSAGDREVLVLRHLEQLGNAEIAAVLGITEGAVKARHLRALVRLRALLGHVVEEEPS
jgi:RNA polymerase sigma-70 factor (ECF subfamily)